MYQYTFHINSIHIHNIPLFQVELISVLSCLIENGKYLLYIRSNELHCFIVLAACILIPQIRDICSVIFSSFLDY